MELMRIIGSMNFHSKFFDKHRVKPIPLYGLLYENKNFHWNKEPETLFQHFKTCITNDITPALPKTNHPFFIAVDDSLFDKSCVSFQMNEIGNLNSISYSF